jgi:hypothetical protein
MIAMKPSGYTNTKARMDGFVLVLLGSLGFLALCFLIFVTENQGRSLVDFRVSYTAARCLLQNGDPYNPEELIGVFRDVNGVVPSDAYGDYILHVETKYFYLPTVFVVTVPFAVLPFPIAQIAWILMIAASCILASFLMWRLASENAPLLSGALLGFYLVNSMSSVIWGNSAGIATSFCVIAVWCFLRNRFVLSGVLCLAVSLLLKPHDSGLVWLCLLLLGGTQRKRAFQTLAVVAASAIPVLVRLTFIAPHWTQEMGSNYAALSGRGAINDPGPASDLARGACMLTNLQSVFGVFWDEPHFYNLATYLLCIFLLLAWMWTALRTRPTREQTWFLLASIAAFSMLPVYHRLYDARLIILCIPAFSLLWIRRGVIRWLALLVTAAAFLSTSDLPWVAYLFTVSKLHLATTGFSGELQIVAKAFPVPLILLCTGIFFLVVALRNNRDPAPLP